MDTTLGIDLGTNSVGWAIRDTSAGENQIVDAGVLTFEKGVGEVKGVEVPIVQARTAARSKRRNYQAEKYRKWALLKALMEHGMCPLSLEELDGWRKYTKGVGRKYPTSEAFLRWLRYDFDSDGKPDFNLAGAGLDENHFLFRALAVSEEPSDKQLFADNPHLLGRVFYHMVQRRGFRGRDDESEEAKTILKGSEKAGTRGVEAIQPYLEKYKTLGAALYHLQRETGERIRKRYNLRADYEKELKEICRVQGIGEELAAKLHKAIVWQRPLRSQKGLVGMCTFEKGKARCPVSHPLYEEYRTWVFINNLKIAVPDDVERKAFLQTVVYPKFFNASRDFKMTTIDKALRAAGGERKAKFDKDAKVVSATLLNAFSNILGPDWKMQYGWNEAMRNEPKPCPYSFEDLWHVLVTFDSREKLKEFATEKLKLSEDKAEAFSKIGLQQGYATLSLAAIKKILPYLYEGFLYSEAVYLANIHKVLGGRQLSPEEQRSLSDEIKAIIRQHNGEREKIGIVNDLIADQLNAGQDRFGMDASYQLDDHDVATIQAKVQARIGAETWAKIGTADQQAIYHFASQHYLEFLRRPRALGKEGPFLKPGRLHEAIGQYLKDTYGATNEAVKKYLWHPSEQESYPAAEERGGVKVLGDPQPISRGFKNPMALKTLHKLKGLVNYLLQEGKIDEDTRIVVEIARELNDANMRRAIERYQREREKQNDEHKKVIDELNAECGTSYNREDKILLDKIRLWKEQNMQCLYTGKIIRMCDLFNGSHYDFEHTIPASMSFDNELKNLTIADAVYNRDVKKNRIPTQLPNYNDECTIGGAMYPAIKDGLGFMQEKVEALEKQVESWKLQSKLASTKDRKDYCIQEKHIARMKLNYWRSKLRTFTDKEYKAGWKNSQLRDTQIITKYALPYLKTVFRKVEVQKGTVTAAFREIYGVTPKTEKKQRTKHSHHAMDAAVLTLIPSASIRDRIVQQYNDEKDKGLNKVYHEPPRHWPAFKAHHVLNLEDNVLINFQAEHRTLQSTRKKVRKRGKQQFVQERGADGKKHYKLDSAGQRIPIVAQGDTIRGALHEESFMGLIKQPVYYEKDGKFIPQTDGAGHFVFQQKGGTDELLVVKKIPLSDLSSLDSFKKIVDPNLRSYLSRTIAHRMTEGKTFEQAMLEPSWAFGKSEDKNGKPLSPIRHIRCRVAKAAGYLSKEKTVEVHTSNFPSKHLHKREVLAGNDEMVYCLLYKQGDERYFRLVSRFDLSAAKVKRVEDFFNNSEYNKAEKGAKKIALPLTQVVESGTKVIMLDKEHDSIDALQMLERSDRKRFLERVFVVNNFNVPAGNTVYIYLVNHLDARKSEEQKKLETKNFDSAKLNIALALTADKFKCAIEGKDFKTNPDGSIKWLHQND